MSNWMNKIIDSAHLAETTRSGAGAVAITSPRCVVITSAANALTLADGYAGQVLFITMRTDLGDGTLTPTNLKSYTTIVFNDVGDWAALEFDGLEWVVLASKGVTLA